MSAWTVSKKHIDLLVTLAAQEELLGGKTETEFGQILWDENYRSVNYRYSEQTPSPHYEFEPFDLTTIPVISQIKQVGCYDYQSCETDDYQSTPAGLFVETLETLLRAKLPDRPKEVSDHPGYDVAPWGID